MTARARPLVSVVIPVFNGEHYLAEAIRSALDQTLRPVEIIVVDDGSEDGSAAIAKGFGSPVICLSMSHFGQGAARNAGVEASRGDLLAFLDADDRWQREKTSRQVSLLAKDPTVSMVFAHASQFVSPDLPREQQNRLACPPQPQAGYYASTMLIRHADFLRAGFFRTDLRVGEFIDWYARATELGLKKAILTEVLVERRLHGDNTSLRERASQSDYLRLLKAAMDRRRQSEGAEAK